MKLSPPDKERKNKEQVINHNKDNADTNKINGKFEIGVIANCINNNFEKINNSAMKDTDNMKEIINKNVDMESKKQITENSEKDVKTKKKLSVTFLKNRKNAPFAKISENDKTNFKCNFENDLKIFKNKNLHKIVVWQTNINPIRNKLDHLMEAVAGNIDILLITQTKIDSTFPAKQFYLNGCNVPYRNDRKLIVVVFWFMFAMTLGHA